MLYFELPVTISYSIVAQPVGVSQRISVVISVSDPVYRDVTDDYACTVRFEGLPYDEVAVFGVNPIQAALLALETCQRLFAFHAKEFEFSTVEARELSFLVPGR